MGPGELGNVYEGLLELHPDINMAARTYILTTAGGNDRKTSGIYYTLSSLINVLLDAALDPVLDEAAKKGPDAILELKVCDPATGSGHFMIAAANRVSCYYCGAPVDGRSGTLEHIDAALGNRKSNLTVACPPCNSGKHARPKSVWLKRLATRGIRHEDLPDSIPVQRRMI